MVRIPIISAVVEGASSSFTAARERLQRVAAIVKKPSKPVPIIFRFSDVVEVASSAFATARERSQRAPIVKKPSKPAPSIFRFSDVAEVASSAFTTARERPLRAPVVKKPLKPALGPISVRNLKITPNRVKPGSWVTIIAEVTSVRPVKTSYSLVLKIKGVVEAIKEITLGPGQSQKVAFTVLKGKPGTYDVDLEGLKGSFTVEK